MGRTVKTPDLEPEAIRRFTKCLLDDLRALMIHDGMIEAGVRRFAGSLSTDSCITGLESNAIRPIPPP